MTLSEVKTAILNNKLSDDLLVFVCKDNSFLADQYVDKLCEVRGCSINKIQSLQDVTSSAFSLVMDSETELFLLRTEVFEEILEDYSAFKNCIIICNKVDKRIVSLLEDYIVNVDPPTRGHIQKYIQTVCKGLSDSDCSKMYELTKGDIYRIDNETAKISLFVPSEQSLVWSKILFECSPDLLCPSFFEFTNAITSKDRSQLISYFRTAEFCEIDPLGVVTNLLNNYKKAMLTLYSQNVSLTEIGVSSSQAAFFRKNYQIYSLEFLTKAISFLSEIDYRIKAGQLDIDRANLMTYVVGKILSF